MWRIRNTKFVRTTKSQPCSARDSEGFASAQWVVLMAMSILLLATLVQGLLIENLRATTIASLRDSARAGTRIADISKPAGQPLAVSECNDRLTSSLAQLSNVNTSTVSCSVKQDPATGKFYMESSITYDTDTMALVPWAGVFKSRISGLKGTYVPTESAK